MNLRWTPQQAADYLHKFHGVTAKEGEADPGPESDLQGKIMKWAKGHGYPCQCFRQTVKAKGFLIPGWPD
jgi:hypothetical protein